MAEKSVVDLGFIESVDDWKLQSKFFPSKVGGKPAWLNLNDLPPQVDMQCMVCDQPMIHLLQIYAPIEDVERCFHRTIFVFMCKNPGCCQPNSAKNFKVFRCQLPRKNKFYSYEPPKQVGRDDIGPSASDYLNLCSLCGCRGTKFCSQCKTNYYCSPHHQKIDWKLGHKEKCKGLDEIPAQNTRPKYTLKEYEIIMETEDSNDADLKDKNEERVQECEKYDQQMPSLAEADLKDLENMANTKSDKWFRRFQKVISADPDQILRYQRGGTPLWISKENIPMPDSIPPCPCGAKRQFEFQILPQLLNSLKLDDMGKSIDWGILLIYTCINSGDCEDKAYHQECIFKQDISSENA